MLFFLFQDALLSLGAVINIAGLRQAAKDALSAVLPRVVGVHPSHRLPALPLSLCLALSCTSPCTDPHLGLGVCVAGEVEDSHEEEFPGYQVLAVLKTHPYVWS